MCITGSYPQQTVYPQQSSAPIYPPAMQVSPQAPPYTDAPPAYSEVTICNWNKRVIYFCEEYSQSYQYKHTDRLSLTLPLSSSFHYSKDLSAQVCAPISGWPATANVSVPWHSDVHATAPVHGCWTNGPQRPHGVLPHGSHVSPWLHCASGGRI